MNKNWDLSPGLPDLLLTALMPDLILVTWPVKTGPWADSSTWDGNTEINLTKSWGRGHSAQLLPLDPDLQMPLLMHTAYLSFLLSSLCS